VRTGLGGGGGGLLLLAACSEGPLLFPFHFFGFLANFPSIIQTKQSFCHLFAGSQLAIPATVSLQSLLEFINIKKINFLGKSLTMTQKGWT